MPLTDAEAKKRIQQMIAFIELEGEERVSQINDQLEENFIYEKADMIQQQCLVIQNLYDKKLKQFNLERKLEKLHLQNNARISVLQYREDRLHDVLNEVEHHLDNMVKNLALYETFLKDLIIQGLVFMDEEVVLLKIRQKDKKLIKAIEPDVCKRYNELSGRNIEIRVDEEYLSSDYSAGVFIYSADKKIRINNTLDERFKLIVAKFLPMIRTTLFGPNPHRRFFK